MKNRTIKFCRTVVMSVLLLTVFIGKVSAHEGRAHPTPQTTPSVATSPMTTDNLSKTEEKPPMNVSEFPNYHPLVVHFPIVLLLMAALFHIVSFFIYRKEFSWATLALLFMGAISAWLASNIFHAHTETLNARASEIFSTHERMAAYTLWLSVAALAAKTVSHFFIQRKWWSEAIVMILLIACSVTVSITGHHGAMLVHIEGVGPQGKHLELHQH